MLFNTVTHIDTSTSMIHDTSTRTLCFLPLLLSFMISNTLSNIVNGNASNGTITLSTTITIEISMINASIPSMIINTGIHHCKSAVTTIAVTVVVTITTITMLAMNSIMVIVTSTRLLLRLFLICFINLSISITPTLTTIIISIIADVCVNSNHRGSTTTSTAVVMVSFNILLRLLVL